MKKTLLLLILPLFLNAQADLEIVKGNKWLKDYDQAIKIAKKEKKNVLVYFTGSDWCPPCKMLKKDLFQSDEFAQLSKSYVLLYVDIPKNIDIISADQMKHNKDLLSKFNKRGVFPLLKVVSPQGKELDEYSGYSMNGEVSYHLKMLNNNI